MRAEILHKVTAASAAAAQVGALVGHAKETVAEAVEDGIKTAQHAVKQSRRAAEGLVDDAEYQVKQRPLRAVGISFGIGLGLGSVIGLLLARRART